MNRLPGILRQHIAALRGLLLFTVLCGIVYPVVMFGAAQAAFHHQANGSPVSFNGRVVGSSLLCQEFVTAKGAPLPQYFQPRPSAATSGDSNDYGCDPGFSAASNLGPNNPDLVTAIRQRQQQIAAFDHVKVSAIPPDAVTASASGLDPYISPEYAYLQADRVASTRHIPAFTLMRSAAAYWRGSEKNPQLQRIYGTAWETRDAQDEYVRMLTEAEKRDHRKLGAELDLFSFPTEIGSGLPVFHPKGGIIRRVMEDYSRRRHEEAGYDFVNTPHLTKEDLFITSGHLEWYKDGMFPPMELDGATYYPKPMNCPMHILIYAARGRSYRELPLRLFEFGTVYRYEKSGVVHGLTRARGFTQDDSHIFCTPDQLQDELASLLAFVVGLLRDFGLTEFEAELSTRPDKYVGDLGEWAVAEAALKHALDESGLKYVIAEGEGAFYAPKIDVHVKDAIGRRWQLSTLQVDLQEPGRFGIEYQAADGSRQRPYMIHRALFGSIERFFGILVEHYAGAFPPWLAPVQAVGIPIADAHVPYLEKIAASLREQGIRVEVDASDDRMQKKIRTAQRQKVPFMLIAGDDDVAAGAVSFRYRDGSQKNGVPVADAVAEIVTAVRDRVQV